MRILLPFCILFSFCLVSPAESTIKPDVSQLPVPAKRFALIIGVESYDDPAISSLDGPNKDAIALQESLRKYAGFDRDNIIVLVSGAPSNLRPTRANILRQLSDLQKRVPQDGLLVVAFSGHGMVRNGEGFLLPEESQLAGNIRLLKDTSISLDLLKENIQAINVRQVILLVDACRNDPEKSKAAMDNDLKAEFVNGFKDYDNTNQNVEAFAVLFASEIGKRSYISPIEKKGYFSAALAEGLSGLAANNYSQVTLSGLVSYLQDRVPPWVASEQGKEQRPWADISGYRANELVIAGDKITPPPYLSALITYLEENQKKQTTVTTSSSEKQTKGFSASSALKSSAFTEIFIRDKGEGWFADAGLNVASALNTSAAVLFDPKDSEMVDVLKWRVNNSSFYRTLNRAMNSAFLAMVSRTEDLSLLLKFLDGTAQAGQYQLLYDDIVTLFPRSRDLLIVKHGGEQGRPHLVTDTQTFSRQSRGKEKELTEEVLKLFDKHAAFRADYFSGQWEPYRALDQLSDSVERNNLSYPVTMLSEFEKAFIRLQGILSTRRVVGDSETTTDSSSRPIRRDAESARALARALFLSDERNLINKLNFESTGNLIVLNTPRQEGIWGLVSLFGFSSKGLVLERLAIAVINSNGESQVESFRRFLRSAIEPTSEFLRMFLSYSDPRRLLWASFDILDLPDLEKIALITLVKVFKDRDAQDRLVDFTYSNSTELSWWACEVISSKIVGKEAEREYKSEDNKPRMEALLKLNLQSESSSCPKTAQAYRDSSKERTFVFDERVGWFH
jgi:hypothetical protein